MAGVAKIPDELSDYVEDFQRRMNNPLEQAKRLSEIASMLGLGIATILKRYAVGKRRLGHYSKRRKELGLDMQAADLLGFALSTISKPIAASIDLTFDCNYGCGECFKHVLKTLGK
ncbi:hypothetical protein JXA85_07800, partial [Candidatus Woesearchaeota archaeon]|nr:hypothetical protein [Candidatus Woesearchaeota archaeon]